MPSAPYRTQDASVQRVLPHDPGSMLNILVSQADDEQDGTGTAALRLAMPIWESLV